MVVAHHGQEALDILQRDQAFDGILIDCQMPVMDSYTATRHICQRPELRAIPIIAMTAKAMAGDQEAAIEAGMIDHISKALDVEKMFVAMARWISPKVRTVADILSPNVQTESVTLPRIDKALQDTDTTVAIRSAHSLKGSAANLGIKGVESRALQLELACKNQADAATINDLLQNVIAELNPVIEALQALPHNEFAQVAMVQMDALTRAALLQQLRDELADDNSQAQDTMLRYLSLINPCRSTLWNWLRWSKISISSPHWHC